MKRHQIIQHREQLEIFLNRVRYILWGSVVLTLFLFIVSIFFLYKEMLLTSVVVATVAYLFFRLSRENAVNIARKWGESRGGQEEMLFFLDKEMKGNNQREFFILLEQAMKLVDS
jgi:hypothetical protein